MNREGNVLTRLYLVPPEESDEKTALVALRSDDTRWFGPQQVRRASYCETAYLAWRKCFFRWVDYEGYLPRGEPLRIDTSGELRDVRRYVDDYYDGIRHQWVVCGGQSSDDDPEHLVGYLQLCLQYSDF